MSEDTAINLRHGLNVFNGSYIIAQLCEYLMRNIRKISFYMLHSKPFVFIADSF